MQLRTEFFLAWRYMRPERNAVSAISCLSILGVALGVAVMVVSIAVMSGFIKEMNSKLSEAYAQIRAEPYDKLIANPRKMLETIKGLGYEATPILKEPAILQKGEVFLPKIALAYDPNTDTRIRLDKKISSGKAAPSPGEIIVSKDIAAEMNLALGDTLNLHPSEKLARMVHRKKGGGYEFSAEAESYVPREFRLVGIYSFCQYKFDPLFVFVNPKDMEALFEFPPDSASAMLIWTKNPFDLEGPLEKLNDEFPNCKNISWLDENKEYLEELANQKGVIFYLLIFIVLVAAFSNTSTLITVVVKKTRETGLLLSLGASPNSVMRIFVMQGFIVGLIGALAGSILGAVVLFWRNEMMHAVSALTGIELFPKKFYFLSELPANISISDISWICLASILLCTLGALIPAWRASKLDPARALRDE